jgi:hypothetical protein
VPLLRRVIPRKQHAQHLPLRARARGARIFRARAEACILQRRRVMQRCASRARWRRLKSTAARRTGTDASKSKRPAARMRLSSSAAAASAAGVRGSECVTPHAAQKPLAATGCAGAASGGRASTTPELRRATRRKRGGGGGGGPQLHR